MRLLQDAFRRRGATRRWCAAFAAALLGCSSEPLTTGVIPPPPPPPDPTPYLWPDTSTMFPGMTRQLRAETFTSADGIAQVSAAGWTSSDPTTATVDASGTVTARTPGQATITALRGQIPIRAEIFVIAHAEPLRFTALDVAFAQTCGVTTSAAIYCWGDIVIGLGAGPFDRCEGQQFMPAASERYVRGTWRCSAIPRRLASTARFRALHVGGWVICGLTESDEAQCWNGASVTPAPFATPPLATMSIGDLYACGIGRDGLGYCWGEDLNGRLANGPGRTPSATPQRILSNEQLTTLSAQYGTCALTAAGEPLCWGTAPLNGTIPAMEPGCDFPCTQAPQGVARDPRYMDVRFTSVVVRLGYGCGLTATKEVYCWGGNAASDVRAIPIIPAVSEPSSGVASLRATFTGPIVALAGDGTAYSVSYRQTGPADSAFFFAPLTTAMPMKQLAAKSGSAGCGIGVDDITYCWGSSGPHHGNGILAGSYPPTSPARVAGQ